MRAGGAGGDNGMVEPSEAVFDRHLARRQVDQSRGNEERADATGPAILQDQRRLVDGAEAADAGADHHAGTVAAFIVLRLPAGILDRLLGRRHREDDELVDLPLVLREHVEIGVEEAARLVALGDFARDLGRKVRGVECLDRADT